MPRHILLALGFLLALGGSAAAQTTLRLTPAAQQVAAAGQTFTLEAHVENYANLRAYSVELFYNTAAFTHTAVTVGSIFSAAPLGTLCFTNGSNAALGRILVDCAVIGTSYSATGADGVAFTVTLQGVGAGGTDHLFGNVILRDVANQGIPTTLVDGRATVVSPLPAASGSRRLAALAAEGAYAGLGSTGVAARVLNAGSGGMLTAMRYDVAGAGGDTAPHTDPDGTVTTLDVADRHWEVTSALTGPTTSVGLAFSYAGLTGPPDPNRWRLARRALAAPGATAWTLLPAASVTIDQGTQELRVQLPAGDGGGGQWALVSQRADCYTSDGVQWCAGWDATNLYVEVSGAFTPATQGVNLYLDLAPLVPVNGGTAAAGALDGPGVDDVLADLPVRADFFAYVRSGSDLYRLDDGAGGWSGGADNTLVRSSTANSLRFQIPWAAVTGAGRPAQFNWLGYVSFDTGSSNGTLAEVPAENPGATGASTGTDLDLVRYFTVLQTDPQPNPFARNSYSFTGDADVSGVGAMTAYDVTMNAPGRTLTRGAGAWTAAGALYVGAGSTLDFGTGGALEVEGAATVPGTLRLGTAAGGDLTVGGALALTGTFDARDRTVRLDGASAQTLTNGTGGPLDLPFLVVDNAAGAVLAGGDLRVDGVLDLRTGGLNVPSGRILALGAKTNPDGTTVRQATLLNSVGTLSGGGTVTFARHQGYNASGWRQIGASLAGVHANTLNDDFHTQGGGPGGWTTYPDGFATLHQWNPVAMGYDPIVGPDPILAAGVGYYFYIYREPFPGGPVYLPGDWDYSAAIADGPEPPSGVAPPLGFAMAGNDVTYFNMVANPYAGTLDADRVFANAGTSHLWPAVWNWDPALNGGNGEYVMYNALTAVPGSQARLIAPGQGFWIQGDASGAPTVQFQYDDKVADVPVTYGFAGSGGGDREAAPYVRLAIEGAGGSSDQTFLVFHDDGTDGRDAGDVLRLLPFAERFATLALETEAGDVLAMDARGPGGLGDRFQVAPLVTAAGTYTLSWPVFNRIPADWPLMLRDRVTGATVDLRQTDHYTFTVDAPTAAARSVVERIDAPTVAGRGGEGARFEVVVGSVTGSEGEGPAALRLDAVAPNPVTASATIRYSLPASMAATLRLYDLLGRNVATLGEGVQAAGAHETTFSVGALAPGVYVLRLEAGGHVLTQRVTVVR